MHKFIKDIIDDHKVIPDLYNQSPLIQYLDSKMGAINGDSKTRRSLGNIYAIYSILYFYTKDWHSKKEEYKKFKGYDYTKLFEFYRSLYGGDKLQNHALNSRVNGEFSNKFNLLGKELIIINEGR